MHDTGRGPGLGQEARRVSSARFVAALVAAVAVGDGRLGGRWLLPGSLGARVWTTKKATQSIPRTKKENRRTRRRKKKEIPTAMAEKIQVVMSVAGGRGKMVVP